MPVCRLLANYCFNVGTSSSTDSFITPTSARHGACEILLFNLLNASCSLAIQCQIISFCIILVSGRLIVARSYGDLQKYYTNPRKE